MMSEVLQANIFFFITGIAVIIFTLLLCVALYHLIKILKSIRKIVDRVEEGSEVIAEDMAQLREYFKEGSFFSHLVSFIFGARGFGKGAGTRRASAKRSRKAKLDITDED